MDSPPWAPGEGDPVRPDLSAPLAASAAPQPSAAGAAEADACHLSPPSPAPSFPLSLDVALGGPHVPVPGHAFPSLDSDQLPPLSVAAAASPTLRVPASAGALLCSPSRRFDFSSSRDAAWFGQAGLGSSCSWPAPFRALGRRCALSAGFSCVSAWASRSSPLRNFVLALGLTLCCLGGSGCVPAVGLCCQDRAVPKPRRDPARVADAFGPRRCCCCGGFALLCTSFAPPRFGGSVLAPRLIRSASISAGSAPTPQLLR